MLRIALHLGCLGPLSWLLYLVFSNQIGTDPAERIVRYLGFSGACLLWLTLTITPLRYLTGKPQWVAYRRALGLWSFAYLALHLSAFLVVWAGLDPQIIWEEVSKRPYVYVGLTGWLLMVPLAITSTRGWRRRLGRRWNQLHKLVYVSAVLGLLHIVWIAKLDYLQPLLFTVTLMLLFLARKVLKPK